MRSGTENLYGIVGFAAALEWLDHNRQEHYDKTLALRSFFMESILKKIPSVQVNGNISEAFLPHIINISFPRTAKSELIMFNLDINGIAASAGSACSSGTEHESHVLQAIGHPLDRKAVRFSFSHRNTMTEIDQTINQLASFI